MDSNRPGLVLGFHGCDKSFRDKIVSTNKFNYSKSGKDYEWLGNGFYFWENSYERALEWAEERKLNSPKGSKNVIENPSVLGAVIDLGYCLDLIEAKHLATLKEFYDLLIQSSKISGNVMPTNSKALKTQSDLVIRKLDYAVIESIHTFNKDEKNRAFDSVRATFFEGEDLYPLAGFKEKNHIQLCIRNSSCIKGFFLPRNENEQWDL